MQDRGKPHQTHTSVCKEHSQPELFKAAITDIHWALVLHAFSCSRVKIEHRGEKHRPTQTWFADQIITFTMNQIKYYYQFFLFYTLIVEGGVLSDKLLSCYLFYTFPTFAFCKEQCSLTVYFVSTQQYSSCCCLCYSGCTQSMCLVILLKNPKVQRPLS